MKKALFAVLTALCLMLVSTVAMAANVYEVTTAAQLKTYLGYVTSGENSKNGTANPGDTVKLMNDINFTENVALKLWGVTLDLNTYKLTTHNPFGGMGMFCGSELKNGTLDHQGRVTAIKVWDANAIEDVDIILTPEEGKIKGGIVLQKGSTTHVGTIKNVTITGVTNGIETYECGDSSVDVIDTIDNVNITASGTGMLLSAPIGTVKNSTITGGSVGVNMYRKGAYSVTADFENCEITGKDAAIWAHDEVFDHPTYNNNGDFELNIDDKTKLTAGDGIAPIQEEIAGQGKTEINIEEPKGGLCMYTEASGKVNIFMEHTIKYDANGKPIKCEVCGKLYQLPSAVMPETGDNSSLFAWLGVLAISCAALTAKRKAYN